MNKNETTLKDFVKGGIFFSLIFLFSGCELPWAIRKEDQKVIVASVKSEEAPKEDKALFLIDGNTAITEKGFQEHVDKIIAMNPQFKHIIETVPSVRYNIFTGMVNEKVLKAWVEKTDITQTEEYKKDHALALSMLEYELARKYFQDDIAKNVRVTASEIKKYYDENKLKNPNFLASQGFMHVVGASFKTEKALADFEKTVKGNEKNIIKKAQEHKISYKDLGRVTQETDGIDELLKEKILSSKKDVSVVKAQDKNGHYWMLSILDRKEATYHALSDVQSGIEQILKSEKIKTAYTEKLEGLKVAYHVEEKKEYFDVPNQSAVLDQRVAGLGNQENEKKETKKDLTKVA